MKLSGRHIFKAASAALIVWGIHQLPLKTNNHRVEAQSAAPFTFNTPAYLEDFPNEPEKQRQLELFWDKYLDRYTEQSLQNDPWRSTVQPPITAYFNPKTTDIPDGAPVLPITWTAYPNRVKYAFPRVGRRELWEYGDNGTPDPDYEPKGPRGWQDEYVEWSVTRNAEGKVTKIAFSAETREYWYALWNVDPNAVLQLYKKLVSDKVQLEDLYLRDDRGKPIIDPQTGRPAYDELNKWNRTTSGGLAHMIGEFNLWTGVIFLGAQSTILRADQQGNPITDPSQIVNCSKHGTHNRFSDAFASAMINDLVRGPKELGSGARVTIKDPVGTYIQEPNFGLFELPPNAPAAARPSDYWKVVRGRKRQNGEVHDLILHAVYEVPPEQGFAVGDIYLNGFPIEYGAQMAEVVQLAVAGQGIGQETAPQNYECTDDPENPLPFPEVLGYADLLEAARRSVFNLQIEQGTTINNIALKASNSDGNTTIEFVGAPGVTANQTDFQEEEDSQIFTLNITAEPNAPLGYRSLLLTDSNGAKGPPRLGMLEVVPPGTLGR